MLIRLGIQEHWTHNFILLSVLLEDSSFYMGCQDFKVLGLPL